jgi:hypothetical protein
MTRPTAAIFILRAGATAAAGRRLTAWRSRKAALNQGVGMSEVFHRTGRHEKRTGQRDANWPDWYAKYIVREQVGKQLPS